MKITKPRYKALILLMLLFSATFYGCRENETPQEKSTLRIRFSHSVSGDSLVTDSMMYTNAAGNPYEVDEIMYFISDLRLYRQDGLVVEPGSWDDIHYTDTRLPETLEWIAGTDIPEGTYDSLTFTFGLSEARNQSFMYVNPPEVNMAWPEVLGGGYHYLMLNGWWNDPDGMRKSYNFHLGIGQIYKNNSGQVSDITGFIQNAFTVNPGGGPFTISPGKTSVATLTMDVESWFETPVIFDFNYYGGAIMQNQEAMHIGCLNGKDAFSLSWQ